MSQSEREKYYSIMIETIRDDFVVPFDCFILLEHSGRIICWVQSGESFSLEKLKKLNSKKIHNIYLKNEHIQSYFTYLDSFLQTNEGTKVLVKAINELKSLEQRPPSGEFQTDEHSSASLDSTL